jgi:hypothetical protein
VSIAVWGVGALLLAIAGIIFRLRALANRRAWNGPVLPLVAFGLPIFAVGLVMIYLTYSP